MIATLEVKETPTAQVQAAERFLDAVGRRDFAELENVFAPNVWFRALLPRRILESNIASDAIAAFRGWIEGASDFRVLATDHHASQGREFVSYRFLLRPDWAPEQWHVMEQSGYLRERAGQISRFDVVCTGFYPVDDIDFMQRDLRPIDAPPPRVD